MTRLLITGGAGFIGSNFVKYLLEWYPKYHITVLDALTYAGSLDNLPQEYLDNRRLRFCHGNIRNTTLVDELVARADVVIHFAAETHVPRSLSDTTTFFETDVLGTAVLSNALLKHPVERFIHISSSEVYGTAAAIPMTEEHSLNPTSPYASAKAGADRLVYSYHVSYGLPGVIVRPFNTYGPHQHLEKVIPRFITSALMNEPLTIHGDGEASRDWLYIEDLCRALDRLLHIDLQQINGEVINLGTGTDLSIRSVAEVILRRLRKPLSLITFMEERPGQVKRHIASTAKAMRLLDWKAELDFNTGIERTINWYAQNQDWWKKLLWMKSVTISTPGGKDVVY